ncbi:MAG: DUF1549 domain-containing protein [Gemmataceae bacterium]
MIRFLLNIPAGRQCFCTLLSLASAAALCFGVGRTEAGPNDPKKAAKKNVDKKADATPKPVAPPAPRSAILTSAAWQGVPMVAMEAAEIDRLVSKELEISKITPAPLTSDEQFIRRVTLDLTGQLPAPADVTDFVADGNSQKRARLIDMLLASEEYAQHWARFWRDVIAARVNDRRGLALARAFEAWMTDQLQKNKPWDKVARAMITAEGECKFDDDGQHGNLFFLASHHGPDAGNERAAETSRIFLGIQIQCAQCHDHPSDQWKRVQFHELAGYFARVQERPVRVEKGRPGGMELISRPRGEHEMPSMEDPKKSFITFPRFLDGKAPAQKDLGDVERRKALADAILDKNNYWFAGAYVNRIWGDLMGHSFYEPVDDMGPNKKAIYANVLVRLAASFRATNYDMKQMFRTILNSQTYQRQIRLGESSDQHLHFAAAYPTRLRPDALWDSLVNVLGNLGGQNTKAVGAGKRFGGLGGLEGLFKDEFGFDPSMKSDDVEGSISQALLLMNNPALNARIVAKGNNVVARILTSYPDDDVALRMLYLKTLARKPTDAERAKCQAYVAKIGKREEAFEDILWALLNSTEFQTKR